jgi:hypothetical protein
MSVKRFPSDIAFSKAIRESYDYTCCHCEISYRHDPAYMHCAHIHTRKHRSTRWDARHGAVALCAKCHRRFTDYPVEWGEFLRGFLGDDGYDEAKKLAWSVKKYTKAEQKEIAVHYRAQTTYMERLRREGHTGVLPLVSFD